MVRVVDLPTEVSGNLSSNTNFVLVSGVSVGTHGTAKVALGELSSFYNNVGALNASGVTALVDSAYIFNIINNSPAGSVTNTAPAFSSITLTPNSRDGYGILDVPKFSDISVTQNSPSSNASGLTYNGNGAFTFTPLLAADSFGELANTPTTISGYGITDAMTASEITTAIDSAITGSDLNLGSNDIITTGKSLYANVYSTEGDLPSASTYHGMFAHVHGTGKGYFSHAGNWHKLIDETNISTQVDSAYILARSAAGVDSNLIINTITDSKYLRSDVHDAGISLSLSNTLHADGAITSLSTLHTDGAITSNSDITAFNSASDRTLKENIERIDNALDKVGALTGYTFNYKGREEKMSGLMADEVEAVLPEVVYNFDGDLKAIRYGNMIGLIVEAINELKSDIDELKEKMS